MAYINNKFSMRSPILGQRNMAYAKNNFSIRSPILGERYYSEDELDNVSVTNSTSTHPRMSRRKVAGRPRPWHPSLGSKKPLAAMARPSPERQPSSSPEYAPESPDFAPAGPISPGSPEYAPRSSTYNLGYPGPSNTLYGQYQPQSPASGPPSLPDYQSPGLHHQEHFAPDAVGSQTSFAVQPRVMVSSVGDDFLRTLGRLNNSNNSSSGSNISSRKRPSEVVDEEFFAPPSKRREYGSSQLYRPYDETTARVADQTLQNARDRFYASRNRSITPVEEDIEMNSSGAPANSNNHALDLYEASPPQQGRSATDENSRPQASFPWEIEYASTETMSGSRYPGPSGLAIQHKPIFAPARGTSSFNPAVSTEQAHRNEMSFGSFPSQTPPQLPRFATQFSQYPQVSPHTSNNDYPMEPRHNIGHDNPFSPPPQPSIQARVFHPLEAREGSVDLDAVNPMILQSYAPSPARSERSIHDTENQNSMPNPPVADFQEENPINRQETDSVTLAEDTPRRSIEVDDDSDDDSNVSHHSNNNNNDNKSLSLQEEVNNIGVELDEVHEELDHYGMGLDDLDDQYTRQNTRLSTLSSTVEALEQQTQTQSDENTQLRDEVNTLKEEASEHKSRFEELLKLVVEVAERSNQHSSEITKLTQQRVAEPENEASNDNNNNKDEVAALKEEVARLQKEVLTLQNEALKKEIAELRESRGL